MDPIQSVKPKDSRTLMVNFNLVSGSSHYIIRVQNSNGLFREDRVSSSPAEIQSLMPYTEYTLSIMAVNSGGRSQPSPPVTAKTGMTVHLHNTPELIVNPKWVLTRKQRVFIPSFNMACRSHSICCIVHWFYHHSNPVSVFGKMQVSLTRSQHQDPSGPLLVTVLDNSNTMTWPKVKM